MLKEYKKTYEIDASIRLPKNWKSLDINEIWKKCTKDYLDSREQDSFNSPWFSALAIHYWTALDGLYNRSKPFFNEYDVHDWFIESLMYVLEHHVWDDPKNKLYQDEKGPDKAFHVHLPCVRATAFQLANTFKRKANATYYNTDDYGDFSVLTNEYMNDMLFDKSLQQFQYTDIVADLFNRKDYFQAFLLDGLIMYNMFTKDNSTNDVVFDKQKLVKFLKNFNDFNCQQFADNYDVDYNKVRDNAHYVTDLAQKNISDRIDNLLFLYKKEDFVKEKIQDV